MSRLRMSLPSEPVRATLLVMAVALIVRAAYAAWNVPEYWGDAYHNWYMTQLTLEHGGILTDYKGREVVWEPLYRYLAVGVTALAGSDGLWPGRLISLLASVTTCGLVTVVGAHLCRSVGWGVGAGLTLALTPWHVAYAWMYMPEATAGLVLMAVLAVLLADRPAVWLVPLAALGVVVRHDVTVLLLLIGVWLLLRGYRRPAAWLVVGMVAGLGLWSVSTWLATGDPFIWLTRRLSGSAANAAFAAADGSRPAPRPWTVPFMLVQVYAPVVVLAVAVLLGWRDREWRTHAREAGLLWALAVGFCVVMALMTLRFFSYPDPRYVLILAPIGAVLSMVALHAHRARARLAGWHWALVVLSLVVQLPTFAMRAWTLSQHRAVGAFLGATATEGRLVVDAPPAIYESGLAADRFRASGQLLEAVPVGMTPREAALGRIRELQVRWVYSFEAPSSSVLDVLPQMRGDSAFVAGGLRFTPVFRYRAPRADGEVASWWGQFRERIERGRDGGRVWHVTNEDS